MDTFVLVELRSLSCVLPDSLLVALELVLLPTAPLAKRAFTVQIPQLVFNVQQEPTVPFNQLVRLLHQTLDSIRSLDTQLRFHVLTELFRHLLAKGPV